MKKNSDRLSESASILLALAMLLGCGGNLSLGTDASNGGAGAQTQVDVGGGGNTGGVGGYLPQNAGGGGAGYAGSINPAPGVDCVCDSVGDSVCSGSLFALCSQIPGCKPNLADIEFSDICGNDPTHAQYSDGERTVIGYRLGANNDYQMAFDTASGDLLGGSLSGTVGLACNLGGKTEFAVGVRVKAAEPICKLCSPDTSGAAGNQAGSGGISDCPPGTP
ncbi:MAG TPA: hypothetical protein VJV79_25105 [Polyangiaceae bacterium]|nr:hypothetical protein [Polyangiaceae bacterium]